MPFSGTQRSLQLSMVSTQVHSHGCCQGDSSLASSSLPQVDEFFSAPVTIMVNDPNEDDCYGYFQKSDVKENRTVHVQGQVSPLEFANLMRHAVAVAATS